MGYWIVKTEPETFSWDQLELEGRTMWDGVRNYQARNNLRKMKLDDMVLIYHSGKKPEIVGTAKVVKEFYPDSTATGGDWSVVDIMPIEKLKNRIPLSEIKIHPILKQMTLVKNSRLSVHSITKEEFDIIMEISGR